MLRALLLSVGFAFVGLTGCSGGTGAPAPAPSPTVLFVPQSTSAGAAVVAYNVTNNAGTQAYAIQGAATHLLATTAVARDFLGNLYALNSTCNGLDSITEYAPSGRDNIAPVATITGAATKLACPEQIVIDTSGNLYVTNSNSNAVTVYPAGSTGNVPPVRTPITGPSLGEPAGEALDGAGNLYVAASGVVSVMPAASAGFTVPTRRLTVPGAHALLVNGSGDLLVSAFASTGQSSGTILVYAPGAANSQPPLFQFSLGVSPVGGGYNGFGMAFGPTGDLYVAVANTAGNGAGFNDTDSRVLVFSLQGTTAKQITSFPIPGNPTPGFITF